jgi:hypothetical protein
VPTLLERDGFVFFMVMFDCRERRHVHVARGGDRRAAAKVWLDPIELATPGKYNERDVARMLRVIEDNRALIIARWDGECQRAGDAAPR